MSVLRMDGMEEKPQPLSWREQIPNNFSLPRRIERLGRFAYNLWWTWNPDGQRLFSLIDSALWDQVGHNPVSFLRKVERARLNAVTNDRFYLDLYDRTLASFDAYMSAGDSWYEQNHPEWASKKVAYFSFEFGLHETIPVYAGGLGVLAGDYLKEASDMGMPIVGIGFIYNQGYFVQRITEDGWQETRNMVLDFSKMPVVPLVDENEKPLTVSIDLPGRTVYARVWKVQVGRVPLYLLNTNLPENAAADQQLTARLYTSDLEVRISQEILLGVGGVRLLRSLGFAPDVWHMNEGHSAFLIIERLRELVQSGSTLEQASEEIRRTDVFTTHTPVPAGNDEFPLWLIDKYFANVWPELGLSRDDFIALGLHSESWGDVFSLPVLALRLSDQRNAVSELHGRVARKMWNFLWPDSHEDEVPILHVTNGVHMGSWLSRRMRLLFDRYLGADWMQHMDDLDLWSQIDRIPDGELWAVRQHLKRKLTTFIGERARQQWLGGGVTPVQVIAGGSLLHPYALTIGFARRFATYKRANLILRDFDRLLKILNRPNMPVQIIFAGKAHPADEPGKLLIQEVYRAVKDNRAGGRLVFLEDYDMNMARYLVQGVDVWLNTPRRPNEASGTSGMKAALNGVLNFSVLDGWWREGYNGRNGWAIGNDTDYDDPEQQDAADGASLYDILENEIVPLYYTDHSSENVPSAWMARVKESIRTLGPQFNTRRMALEYLNELYLPALSWTGSSHTEEVPGEVEVPEPEKDHVA